MILVRVDGGPGIGQIHDDSFRNTSNNEIANDAVEVVMELLDRCAGESYERIGVRVEEVAASRMAISISIPCVNACCFDGE
jgi:hypothetical protein